MPAGSQGYDIESRAADGTTLFICVKTHGNGDLFTVTRGELGVAANAGDRYVLALVGDGRVRYARDALDQGTTVAFPVSSVELPWRDYFGRGREPW